MKNLLSANYIRKTKTLLVLAVVFTLAQSCSLITKNKTPYSWTFIENCECYLWAPEDDFTYEWEGETFENFAHGEGTLKLLKDNSLVETQSFTTDNPVFYGATNKEQAHSIQEDFYIGKLNEGLFDGMGLLIKANGDKFVGEFKNGMPHGELKYFRGANLRYSGTWKDGSYHGYGTQYLDSGVVKEGTWENGELVGK